MEEELFDVRDRQNSSVEERATFLKKVPLKLGGPRDDLMYKSVCFLGG